MGNRQIDGFAFGQTGIEIIDDRHRAGVRAGTAADTPISVYPIGMLPERHPILSGLAFHRNHFRGKQNFDIFVKQAFPQTVLGAGIPIDHRQHFTHTATIGGKLVIKLAEDASQVG